MTHRLVAIFITAVLVALLLAVDVLPGAERSVADWLKLTFELQEQQQRLDRNDQRFIRYMINWLDVEEQLPTKRQARWLLDIKRRLDEENDCLAKREAAPNGHAGTVPRPCR